MRTANTNRVAKFEKSADAPASFKSDTRMHFGQEMRKEERRKTYMQIQQTNTHLQHGFAHNVMFKVKSLFFFHLNTK